MEKKIIKISTEHALNTCKCLKGDDRIYIERELEKGFAEAFIIDECVFITRFDNKPSGKELVIMCAQGKGLLSAGEVLKSEAKKHGCKSVRMHTKRKGMIRFARQFGWVQKTIIYEAEI